MSRTRAWSFVIDLLIEKEELLEAHLCKRDAAEVRNDLKQIQNMPAEMVAQALHEEYRSWQAAGAPEPKHGSLVDMGTLLCYYMQMFANIAVQEERTVH